MEYLKDLNMEIILKRAVRAAKLDVALYEEVAGEKQALKQAACVVLVSALAAGLVTVPKFGISSIVITAILGLIAWVLWVGLNYFVGMRFFPEPGSQVNLGRLLRTIGFSNAPGIIRVLAIFPDSQRLVSSFAAAWMLVAMAIAVKAAFNYKNIWKAVGVCVVSFLILIFFVSFMFILAGGQVSPP